MTRTRDTANQRRARGAMHKRIMRANGGYSLNSTIATRNKRAAAIQSERAQQGAKCPQPDKRAYVTQDEANEALWHSWRTADGRTKPVRTYQCVCGCWHLTAQAWEPDPQVRKQHSRKQHSREHQHQ